MPGTDTYVVYSKHPPEGTLCCCHLQLTFTNMISKLSMIIKEAKDLLLSWQRCNWMSWPQMLVTIPREVFRHSKSGSTGKELRRWVDCLTLIFTCCRLHIQVARVLTVLRQSCERVTPEYLNSALIFGIAYFHKSKVFSTRLSLYLAVSRRFVIWY